MRVNVHVKAWALTLYTVAMAVDSLYSSSYNRLIAHAYFVNHLIMKLLLITLLLALGSPVQQPKTQPDYVYICASKDAVAYHKTKDSCSGIKNCKHEILKVTKIEAISKYHLRACKLCYR